ncbi:hypothetical protein L249_8008 [Ophiocordyceps polyrhachis-furcata BCC 54312]|uniref:USP domain-containing protein n=1 Tax=Ophiocordyceps polyrhachis-furcata BCC 54312 TaxID=1330021 RepID=A0A367LHD4_9HYPO|nr:hypothetical protein L249_8008 [Ophiocordyceps polyrhachis-furcata BCC 54312]
MDPASTPSTLPEIIDEAPEPEPPVTRPNPFDDDDTSSRKRRRTSVSGSPAASFEPANTMRDTSGIAVPDSTDAMIVEDSLNEPRTPENHRLDEASTVDPPSSKVTINIRKRNSSASPTAALASSLSRPDTHSSSSPSIAPEEISMEDAHEPSSASHRSSSLSATPPIEIVADADSGGVPVLENMPDSGANVLILDPTLQFPYTEADECLSDTLQRLTQYLSTTKPIDPSILIQVSEWLDEYLRYAKHADPNAVLLSRRTYQNFWLSFPDPILAVTTRRAEHLRHPALRTAVLNFYTSFAELSARFVQLDCLALSDAETLSTPSDRRAPYLLSPIYLQQLHGVIGPHGLYPHAVSDGGAAGGWIHSELESFLMDKFQAFPGGSIESLSQLSAAMVRLVPHFPRLMDNVAPVCQMLAACMKSTQRALRLGQEPPAQVMERLEQGHEAWVVLSSALVTTIDKQVTSLSSDQTAASIQALMEILKASLQGEHKCAVGMLEEQRKKYPAIPPNFAQEAIAWQWKVDILEKLIRSSQMQLRVMAAANMCNNLVTLWKRLCDGGEMFSSDFLEHLSGYLLETGLVDYILGANCHPEIIIESANIIGFLVVTRTYRAQHTDHVWRVITSSQDPRVVDALTRMMTNITNLCDFPGLLYLCEKFGALPVDRFTPSLRLLLENVLGEMIARSQADQTTLTFQPFGLCLRLLRESSICASGSQVVDPEMQQVAMQKFRELLGHGPDAEGRRKLYLSCIEDISAKSVTTLGSLWCLSMAIRHATVDQMQLLTEHHDLAKLIIEELEHAGEAGRAAGVFPILSGKSNQPRRDFVTNLIQHQPGAITGELGLRLWNILVGPQSTCLDDRKAGWHIISSLARKASPPSAFLQTCFSEYLPKLSAAYFCEGTLEFVKERLVRFFLEESREFVFDDAATVSRSGIEQLWRIILEADNPALVGQAISILAVEIYLESNAIASYPMHRARQVHLALVIRCLRQMKETAIRIKGTGGGSTSGDGEPMVIVGFDEEMRQQELIFVRSLQLLRFFLEKYQSKPNFAVADLRSFMSEVPEQIDGESARLRYQSFGVNEETDILPLNIGRLNTVSSLLATIRAETGFDSFRVYYRGHQLLPTKKDVCKSLQDLDIQDGFILVKREENYSASPSRIKPGSLPLEVEILAHFAELWDYLSMDDKIAEQIYDFVVRLPADGYIMSLFDKDETSYRDLFLSGQPFKSLYAIHALVEYVDTASNTGAGNTLASTSPTSSHEEALRRAQHFVVQALSDPGVLQGTTDRLQVRLASALMQEFVALASGAYKSRQRFVDRCIDAPAPERLMEILGGALDHSDDEALPLISNTCSAVLLVSKLNAQFWIKVTQGDVLRDLLQKLILLDPRKAVRVAATQLIEASIEAEVQAWQTELQAQETPETEAREPFALAQYLWPIVSGLLAEAVRFPAQCEEFFGLLKMLLSRLSTALSGQMQLNELAGHTSSLLLQHTSTEDVSQQAPYDPVASSLASALYLCLQIDASLLTSGMLPKDLAEKLMWRHLFPQKLDEGATLVPRVVLNSETRARLYDIVLLIVKQDHHQLGQLLQLLDDLVPFYSENFGGYWPIGRGSPLSDVEGPDEPYAYDLPFQFERAKAMRSPCGYVGLRNLSNTCYLNSLLTQLYMNTGFRRFILGVPCLAKEGPEQLLSYTQKVFAAMQESYRRFVDPSDLVSSIKTYEDTVIDIHNQMDVDEFYSLLFDRWEGELLQPDDKRTLRSFYGGQLVQQVKSKECEHISERLEPFAAIQCDIKGKSTLRESLQAYVDGEIMEGDNKYKCSTCDRHVDAVKRACLKDVPDNVIFHLKRFDFNLRTLQRSKINDYFSFSTTIDLRPYTIEHLDQATSAAEEDLFELVGILVHSGTAESGHYYSYIKERPSSAGRESWVEFNDDMVTPWDPSLMASSTFGGPDNRPVYETNGIMYDKSYSAYMLFYQRVSSLKAEQDAMVAQQLASPLLVAMPSWMREHIAHENIDILRRHCLFDPGHATFVQNCFTRARFLDAKAGSGSAAVEVADDAGEASHEVQDLAMEMALSHLDQIITRTKDTPSLVTFSNMTRAAVANCPKCALALYFYFDSRHVAFRALLQRCPDQQVRAFAGEVLIKAAQTISEKWPRLYRGDGLAIDSPDTASDGDEMDHDLDLDLEHSVMQGVVNLFNCLWQFFHVHLRSWDEYFGTILAFAKLGDREVALLLSDNYLSKLLRIVTADSTIDLAPNYARMLNNVLRRISTRPPSYSAILSLIEYLLGQLDPVLGPDVIVDRPTDRLTLQAPFPWTSDEVHMFHYHPNHQSLSFFVEKLVSIDQVWGTTDDIVARLTSTGDVMDSRAANVLRRNIQGDLSTQPMDPYLRVAARYVECSRSADRVHTLVRHVGAQARGLQNSEGLAFLNFFRVALTSEKPGEQLARLRRESSLATVPAWAPHLLVYPDANTRREAEQLLDDELFPPATGKEGDKATENKEQVDQVVRELGLKCLIYLREAHVKRRSRIERDAAWSILRVVTKCGGTDMECSDEDNEFVAIQAEIMDPLRRLMVDEVEEDASDWDDSCASSDPMDTNVGVPVQTMNELNDADLL